MPKTQLNCLEGTMPTSSGHFLRRQEDWEEETGLARRRKDNPVTKTPAQAKREKRIIIRKRRKKNLLYDRLCYLPMFYSFSEDVNISKL